MSNATKAGPKIELIAEWKQAYKFWSLRLAALMAILPDLYNLAVASEILDADKAPEPLSYAIKMLSFLVAASRLVKQSNVLTPEA